MATRDALTESMRTHESFQGETETGEIDWEIHGIFFLVNHRFRVGRAHYALLGAKSPSFQNTAGAFPWLSPNSQQQFTAGPIRADETMYRTNNCFGNRPIDEDDFSETDAPGDLDANESVFNETEVKELASKASKIALDEREAGLFDIHGVAPSLEEDPDLLTQSLKEMNEMLTSMICWRQASAFKLAESQDPQYTRSAKLLLMFLRCENFNVKAAATRMIAFFRHKLSLFGPERLCKETIGQSDLDAEDLKCVTAGYVQLLPRRDHVGRAQLIYFSRFGHWDTHGNAVSEMSLDAESRSEVSASDIDWLFAIHFVVKDDVLFLHGGIKRRRDAEEGICPYHAQRGERRIKSQSPRPIVGMEVYAIDEKRDLKVDRHKEIIRSLKRLETQRSPAERYVILPMNTDVLLGRGKPTQNHPGN
eukprot:scaffold16689_cov107-Cylindrotheca_fusiformis.AAC.1